MNIKINSLSCLNTEKLKLLSLLFIIDIYSYYSLEIFQFVYDTKQHILRTSKNDVNLKERFRDL